MRVIQDQRKSEVQEKRKWLKGQGHKNGKANEALSLRCVEVHRIVGKSCVLSKHTYKYLQGSFYPARMYSLGILKLMGLYELKQCLLMFVDPETLVLLLASQSLPLNLNHRSPEAPDKGL